MNPENANLYWKDRGSEEEIEVERKEAASIVASEADQIEYYLQFGDPLTDVEILEESDMAFIERNASMWLEKAA